MYSLKLKNITRRNLLPTTCQSMRNVRGAKLLSSKYIAARDEAEKRRMEKEREYWHDGKELRKCSDRDAKRAGLSSSCRVSEKPDWFVELSLSTRWHRVVLHFREIAIPLSSRPLLPSCGFAPANFKSAISCGRYLTPVHSSSRVQIPPRFCSSVIARWLKLGIGFVLDARARSQSFTLMCLHGCCVLWRVTTGRAFVSRIHTIIGVIGG